MTTIKASCPCCGEVELTNADIRLMVCDKAGYSYYAFDCPVCGDEVRKPADEHIISLLISGGVPPIVFEMPAEVIEPKFGKPLTHDDLLDFALALDNEQNIVALAANKMIEL